MQSSILLDSIEYQGYWRIPGKPQTIAGTLTFSATQGGTLELLGNFEEINQIQSITQYEIIQGFTPDGKNITLYKCIKIHASFSQPGYVLTRYYVNVIFIGALFDNSLDITFKSISINFFNLDEWLGLNFLNYKHNKSKKEYILKYKIPIPRKIPLDDALSLLIDFNLNVSTARTHGTMRQTPFLKFEHSTEKHFDEYYRNVYQLQNFLTFSMNSASYPIMVLGYSKKHETTFQNQPIPTKIEILFRTHTTSDQKFNPYLILFNYTEISRKFKTIMKAWFKYTEKYQSIIDLYFGTFYQPEMYQIHRFLSLIYSLEGYHRLRFGNRTELPVTKYNKMLSAIFSKISNPNYKKWLKDELKYSNEISLRKRIKEIINRIDAISINSQSKQKLVDKIVNTRNYYSHFDETLKNKAAKANELHHLNNKLNIAFQLSMMYDLKIPVNQRVKENLVEIFNRNSSNN